MEYDRRSGYDRRKNEGFSLRLLIGNGKRLTIRRSEDRDRIFWVDQYSPILFATIAGILFLCVIDTLLTLYLLNSGAYEINPIMAYLLKIGPFQLFIFKYVFTCVATFSLFLFRAVVVRRFNISTHSILHFIAWIYVSIVAWELYLVYNVI
jgi:hypothetical protein